MAVLVHQAGAPQPPGPLEAQAVVDLPLVIRVPSAFLDKARELMGTHPGIRVEALPPLPLP
jgi:hypothetical protein